MGKNTVLMKGQKKSTDVIILQKKLNELGYTDEHGNKLDEDGNFGANTEYAVKQFQLMNNLDMDGKVGNKTWTALELDFDNNYETQSVSTGTPLFYQKGLYTHWKTGVLQAEGGFCAQVIGGDYQYGAWSFQTFSVGGEIGINKGAYVGAEAAILSADVAAKIPLPNGKKLIIEVSGSVGSIGGTVCLDLEKGVKVEIAYGAGVGISVRVE